MGAPLIVIHDGPRKELAVLRLDIQPAVIALYRGNHRREAYAMTSFMRLGQAVTVKLYLACKGVSYVNAQSMVCYLLRNDLHPALGLLQLGRGKNGVFHQVAQNRAVIHLGNGELLGQV